MKVLVNKHAIQIGDRFMLSLQRTLRIPNDGKIYPLPPGMGNFPIYNLYDENMAPAENFTTLKSLEDSAAFIAINIMDSQLKKLGKKVSK